VTAGLGKVGLMAAYRRGDDLKSNCKIKDFGIIRLVQEVHIKGENEYSLVTLAGHVLLNFNIR